jgi:hypothetical protein
MQTVAVREILNDHVIIRHMLTNFRTWPKLEFHGPGSHTYETITSWCNIDKDLVWTLVPGVKTTHNGIIYDVQSGSFVNTDDYDWVGFDFSNYLPDGLADALGLQVPEQREFVRESMFREEDLEPLQKLGAIGPRLNIPVDMLS